MFGLSENMVMVMPIGKNEATTKSIVKPEAFKFVCERFTTKKTGTIHLLVCHCIRVISIMVFSILFSLVTIVLVGFVCFVYIFGEIHLKNICFHRKHTKNTSSAYICTLLLLYTIYNVINGGHQTFENMQFLYIRRMYEQTL